MTPKRTIAGRYELQEQIGSGGMAAVWRARDNRLDREVAVKLMRADLSESREFAARFADEARRTARFSHPNIVGVHDYGVDRGTQFIVMELVRGRTLAQLIRHQGRLTPRRAASVASEVAAALQAAHRYGVVHRDVKPSNILIGADGHVKLADLGIAQAADEAGHTTTGQTLGSVEYFSPEQARGEPAGPQTDVYAFGVVLYEMLTGRRPFGGDSPAAIAISRLTTPPPDPRAVVPTLPHALVLICMRALALDPQRRYRSARGLRVALARWLSTSPVDATSAQPDPVVASVASASTPPPSVTPTPSVQQPVHARVPTSASPVRPARRRAGPEDDRAPRRFWPVLAAVLLLLAVVGFAGQRLLAALGDVDAEAPGLGVLASATPAPTVEPTPIASTPSRVPAETARERRTPEPTPQPTLAPTAQPPTPAAQVADAGLSAPEAVARFYARVTDARFDAAYALWSDRMRATYPRQENLDERFDATAAIDVHRIELVSQSGDSAVVAIDFTETYEGGSSRRFQGTWDLVPAGDGWLLDAPHF